MVGHSQTVCDQLSSFHLTGSERHVRFCVVLVFVAVGFMPFMCSISQLDCSGVLQARRLESLISQGVSPSVSPFHLNEQVSLRFLSVVWFFVGVLVGFLGWFLVWVAWFPRL